MTSVIVRSACAALAVLWLGVPASTRAADTSDAAKATYLRYCSACHGESGKGDGVVSQLMRPKPTDLTQLAKQNQGEFPYGRMMRVVDGRDTLRAHGDPDMPVWGEIFKAEDGMTIAEEAEVRGKLMLIVDHLGAIQVP